MPKPKIEITESVVHSLPLASGAHVDKSLPGFMVLCGRQSRTYAYQREVDGRTLRVNLGRAGQISAESARLEALKSKKAIDQGQNPNTLRKVEAAKSMSLADAYTLYKNSSNRSPATMILYDSLFQRYLEPWANERKYTLVDIGNDRPGVRKLHEEITASVRAHLETQRQQIIDKNKRKRRPRPVPEVTAHAGHSTANNVLLLLKGIYNRARKEVPVLPSDPTENVNWHDDHVRQNALPTDDMKKWYDRVMSLTNPVKQAYWIAVLLTGARRNSVAEARWEDVDLEQRRWHFPKPKGGEELRYTVPMSRYLVDRLCELKIQTDSLYPNSEWVFPSDKSDCGHITLPRNDRQGLPMSHALRHTYRTHCLLAGVSDVHSHLLMNHKLEGVNYSYITRAVTLMIWQRRRRR